MTLLKDLIPVARFLLPLSFIEAFEELARRLRGPSLDEEPSIAPEYP